MKNKLSYLSLLALMSLHILVLKAEVCFTETKNEYDSIDAHGLRKKLHRVLLNRALSAGIGIYYSGSDDTVNINGDKRFPMQSVYKFHLALAVIKASEQGKFSLQKTLHVTKKDLRKNTWSPLREKYPKANIDISIAELLRYSVSLSDNNACDILFRLLGGPLKVDTLIHQMNFVNTSIVADENAMHKNTKIQYRNYSSPADATLLLEEFYKGKILSESGTAFLMKLMSETSNSPMRIKAGLPPNVPLAHKTGTSGTENGIRAACNDIGIISLPGGSHICLSVFIMDAQMSYDSIEMLIAELSRVSYRHFLRFEKPKAVIKHDYKFTDQSRNRLIPVSAYLPIDSAFALNKLVIISGGYGISHTNYSFIAERLAGIGYTVISIQHNLESDDSMPRYGNIFEQRMPVWNRGVLNIRFVLEEMKRLNTALDTTLISLIGHSNGGDISCLYAGMYPNSVAYCISLDHRRMPIPLNSTAHILSIRAADTEADPGVLPSQELCSQKGIRIVKPGAHIQHSTMCDAGSEKEKQDILYEILNFMCR